MIDTDLVGRIERMRHPRNAFLPLFEAVSNSIDAIRARQSNGKKDTRKGVIEVHLARVPVQVPLALSVENTEPITEIRVIDNGIGFTAENLAAFKQLDTRFKIAAGGKGVGRLTWLKVFERVTVSSVYRDALGYRKRSFDFKLPDGVENVSDGAIDNGSQQETSTTITLSNPNEPFRQMMRNRTETIAAALAKHFLYYLLDANPPDIKVIDGPTVVPLLTNNVIAKSAGQFTINTFQFAIEHLKIRSPEKPQHSVNYCANRRPVKEERLRQLPDHRFEDDKEGFFYQAYVSSPFLDSRVDEQRTSLDLEDEPNQFGVSKKELQDQVNAAANEFLSAELTALSKENEKRIERIIKQNIPQLEYVMRFNRDDVERISFDNTDAEVESRIGEIHLKNQKEGRALMGDLVRNLKDSVNLDLKSFEENLADRIKKITEPNAANLAGYVLYRGSIIDLYSEILKKSGDRFEKEAAIHNLMFPMGKDLDTSAAFFNHNLWLLDERLTFASYIASDLPINQHRILFNVESKKEPDIVCYYNLGFSEEDPGRGDLHDVVIVELKRPGPYSKRLETPWDQTISYILKIRKGFWEEGSGKRIKASENTRFYCYIICGTDNDKIQNMIEKDRFKPIYGGAEGYFLYHENYRAYVELIPFEKILRDAERKHRAFFERLGLIRGD